MADPVYHVTFSKSLPDIQERGLDPLSGSLWQQAETGERYQDQPSVFSFQDPEEALRWASKMQWDFRDDISDPSDISIVKLRGGDHWERDPAAGGLDIGATSMRSLGHVPSSDILEVMPLPTPAGKNEEFLAQHPEGDLEQWLKFYGNRLRGQEPPPTDQPRLPPLLAPPGEPGKKPSKGSIFRGIGSLMRGRIFPLIQAAQAGWGALSPEARAEVEAFLKRPAHELVGMDKPGIEYFKEWLGISPENLGETPSEAIPLSDLQKYIATYHGGPSKWAPEPGYPEGRPRLEMVGTGEGAAAYGHGFYSAEAKGVARTYQDDLTRNRWRDIQDRIDIDPETELYRATRQDGTTKNFANEMDAQQFIADDLGALYKIDIPEADAANLLDWDAPLSGQSAGVREAFQKAFEGAGIPDAANMNPNGKSAYTRLAAALGRGVKDADTILKLGSDPKRASEALRKAGIPGLRYLDQFSRDNENLYKGKSLVKKNGKALFLNEDWQRQGRNVLQYLVDNNMDMDEFISQRREFHGRKGRISRALGGARQQEKFLDILEGTTVQESPLTRNYVIWDQGLLDQLRTVRKEAAGGFIDKPLYEEARVGGLI